MSSADTPRSFWAASVIRTMAPSFCTATIASSDCSRSLMAGGRSKRDTTASLADARRQPENRAPPERTVNDRLGQAQPIVHSSQSTAVSRLASAVLGEVLERHRALVAGLLGEAEDALAD